MTLRGTLGAKRAHLPIVVASLVSAVLITATAQATSVDNDTRFYDLRDLSHGKIIGGSIRVGGAGDVNGDGDPDIALGGLGGLGDGRGMVFVLFGPIAPERIDATAGNIAGFSIVGASEGDAAFEVGALGDVNGDGLDDVIVGASGADRNGRDLSGAAYVVFGKTDTTPVELGDMNEGSTDIGFRIDGPATFSLAGDQAEGVGDLNADGLDDFLVGAPFNEATYVVFGKATTDPVDLRTFDLNLQGPTGFRIDHPSPAYSDQHYSANAAGDVNGDGVPDLVLSVIRKVQGAGTAWVVFGKADPLPVDVDMLGEGGFRIPEGGQIADGTGDVNRDGLADVAVTSGNVTRVIFGKASAEPVNLNDYSGYFINNDVRTKCHGLRGYCSINVESMEGGADLNGDGRGDLIIGSSDGRFHDPLQSGSVFVVYGRSRQSHVSLRNLGTRGYGIRGERKWGRLGFSVGSVGDGNRDGRDEILMGAWRRGIPDKAYVLAGRR